MNQKSLNFLLILNFILINYSLNSFPYKIARLIDRDGDKITKVVDLLYEVHIPLVHRAPAASRIGANIETGLSFTDVERRLIRTFGDLNKLNRALGVKSTLVWEANDNDLPKCNEVDITQEPFLIYMGCKFYEIYAKSRNQNIIFVTGDNIRRLVNPGMSRLRDLNEANPALLIQSTSIIIDYFNAIKSAMQTDINSLRNKVSNSQFNIINNLWQTHELNLNNILTEYKIAERKNLTLKQFFEEISKKNQSQNFRNDWFSEVTEWIPNLEMLIKIITSENKHVILYAGGAHTHGVENTLKTLGFEKIIDIGLEVTDFKSFCNVHIPLKASEIEHVALGLPIKFSQVKLQKNTVSCEALENLHRKLNSRQDLDNIVKSFIEANRIMPLDIINMVTSGDNKTLLHLTIENKIIDLVKELLDQPNIALDIEDNNGKTPIILAIEKSLPEVIKLLLQKGASRNMISQKLGSSPLHEAVINNNIEAANLLLINGADINKQTRNKQMTPLMYAIDKNLFDMAKFLLNYPQNLNLKDEGNKTALDLLNNKINNSFGENKVKFQELKNILNQVNQNLPKISPNLNPNLNLEELRLTLSMLNRQINSLTNASIT